MFTASIKMCSVALCRLWLVGGSSAAMVKDVQSGVYFVSSVVGGGGSAAMVKEETKLAVNNFLC